MIMEILKPEQIDKIEEFLKNTKENSPLVIIGQNDFKRNDLLNKICTKFDWQIINSLDLIADIIGSLQGNNTVKLRKELISRPSLVINDLDLFKGKETLQWYLEKMILRCRNPVILVMESYEGFSYDIRAIITDSTVIYMEENRVHKP